MSRRSITTEMWRVQMRWIRAGARAEAQACTHGCEGADCSAVSHADTRVHAAHHPNPPTLCGQDELHVNTQLRVHCQKVACTSHCGETSCTRPQYPPPCTLGVLSLVLSPRVASANAHCAQRPRVLTTRGDVAELRGWRANKLGECRQSRRIASMRETRLAGRPQHFAAAAAAVPAANA